MSNDVTTVNLRAPAGMYRIIESQQNHPAGRWYHDDFPPDEAIRRARDHNTHRTFDDTWFDVYDEDGEPVNIYKDVA